MKQNKHLDKKRAVDDRSVRDGSVREFYSRTPSGSGDESVQDPEFATRIDENVPKDMSKSTTKAKDSATMSDTPISSVHSSESEENNGKSEHNATESLLKVRAHSGKDQLDNQDKDLRILENKISELEEERARLKETILRGLADAENTRKRLKKLYDENINEKISEVMKDVVLVLDDFERARSAMNPDSDTSDITEGLKMVEKSFQQVLASKWNLCTFESMGKHFDPELHEAISREEDETTQEPTVVEVYQKGYMLGERVLRPAKVKVLSQKYNQT